MQILSAALFFLVIAGLLARVESFSPHWQNGAENQLVLLGLIFLSTLISEDLTCISTGVLISQGKIGFLSGTLACFAGIYAGDLALFLLGRYLGRPALSRLPLKWLVSAQSVARSSAWFARRGAMVIAISRFVPGMRLPTYFAAGALQTSLRLFTGYFFLACALWTPLLVGLAMWTGGEILSSAIFSGQHLLWKAMPVVVLLSFAARQLPKLMTWRGRRLLSGTWRRIVCWEFWPMWAFYPPVIAYILWLTIRHRHLTLFTACNPAIPASGIVGESKSAILEGLQKSSEFIARYFLLPASGNLNLRLNTALALMKQQHLEFPIVLKPDVGERGKQVQIIRTEMELEDYLKRFVADTIIQQYIPGDEFGVFYYRLPDEERGQIFSITEKRMSVVTGNGHSTLEKLILEDERAVCMAQTFLQKHQGRLEKIPAQGEKILLTELGSHCRGAIFLDGRHLKTSALEEAIEQISQQYTGFYFGRYDLRAASVAEFQKGHFKIIELNGVTSEATHIYDPRHSVLSAWRTICHQWAIAFEIGRQNHHRGVRPSSLRECFRILSLCGSEKARH
jgi:membrane protein DedA with SNARE-associated domain